MRWRWLPSLRGFLLVLRFPFGRRVPRVSVETVPEPLPPENGGPVREP